MSFWPPQIVNGLVVFGWFLTTQNNTNPLGCRLSPILVRFELQTSSATGSWSHKSRSPSSTRSCPVHSEMTPQTIRLSTGWRSRLIPALLWTQGMPWVPWSISIKGSRALLQVLVPGSPCILDGWCCRTGAQWRQAEAGPSVFGTFLRGIGSHWFTEFTGKSLPLLQQFAEMVIFHGGNNVLTVNHHGGGSRNLPCILWEKVPFLVLLARSVMKAQNTVRHGCTQCKIPKSSATHETKAQRSALLGFHCSIVATKNEPGTATGVPRLRVSGSAVMIVAATWNVSVSSPRKSRLCKFAWKSWSS